MLAAFAVVLVDIRRESRRRDKAERDRFREFVLAVKSKDAEEYTQILPAEGDLPMPEEDELVELDQIDPETLLRVIKDESH